MDAGPSIQVLLSSFRLTLRAEGLSERTFNIYADAIRRLEAPAATQPVEVRLTYGRC